MLVIFNDIFYLSYLYLNIVILWFVLFHLTSWLAFRLIQLLCTSISQRHRPYSVKSGLLNLSSPSPVGVWYQTDLFHGLSTKCTMFCNWQNVLPGDTSWLNRSSRPRSTIGSEELLLPRVVLFLKSTWLWWVVSARRDICDGQAGLCYYDVVAWNHFLQYWPFVRVIQRVIHQWPSDFPHGKFGGSWIFLLTAWTNCLTNSRVLGYMIHIYTWQHNVPSRVISEYVMLSK